MAPPRRGWHDPPMEDHRPHRQPVVHHPRGRADRPGPRRGLPGRRGQAAGHPTLGRPRPGGRPPSGGRRRRRWPPRVPDADAGPPRWWAEHPGPPRPGGGPVRLHRAAAARHLRRAGRPEHLVPGAGRRRPAPPPPRAGGQLMEFIAMAKLAGQLDRRQVLVAGVAVGWVEARRYPWSETPRWLAWVYGPDAYINMSFGFGPLGKLATWSSQTDAGMALVRTAGLAASLDGEARP